jgi:hypothetical protein
MQRTTSTSTTRAPAVPPKVQSLQESAQRLREYKAKHREVFAEFERLIDDYNQKLEDAEKEARAVGQTTGPFVVVGYQVNIDEDRLYEELGPEDFAKVGGQVELKRVLSVDRLKFTTYADSGMIPKEVLEVCYEKKPKFKTPKKVELP